MLETLKRKLVLLHFEHPKYDLGRWTSGNVSGCDPEMGVVGRTAVEVLR